MKVSATPPQNRTPSLILRRHLRQHRVSSPSRRLNSRLPSREENPCLRVAQLKARQKARQVEPPSALSPGTLARAQPSERLQVPWRAGDSRRKRKKRPSSKVPSKLLRLNNRPRHRRTLNIRGSWMPLSVHFPPVWMQEGIRSNNARIFCFAGFG